MNSPAVYWHKGVVTVRQGKRVLAQGRATRKGAMTAARRMVGSNPTSRVWAIEDGIAKIADAYGQSMTATAKRFMAALGKQRASDVFDRVGRAAMSISEAWHDLISAEERGRKNPSRCACGRPSSEPLCPRCQAIIAGITAKSTGTVPRPVAHDPFAAMQAERDWLARERREIEGRYARRRA